MNEEKKDTKQLLEKKKNQSTANLIRKTKPTVSIKISAEEQISH